MFGTDGVEFRTLGGPGTAAGQLDGPAAIDVFEQFSDLAGNLFIADYANKRVQRWNPFGFTFWAMPADGAAPGPQAPVNTAKPQILGTAAVGQSLTCTDGTWSNNPTSFTRSWARDGAAIPGATGSQYTVVGADAGHALTCTVTATNAAGSGQATSNPRSIPAGSAAGELGAAPDQRQRDGRPDGVVLAGDLAERTDLVRLRVAAQRRPDRRRVAVGLRARRRRRWPADPLRGHRHERRGSTTAVSSAIVPARARRPSA